MTSGRVRRLSEVLVTRLAGRPVFQKILKSSGWLVAERLFRMPIGLLIAIALARYLGPADLGIYAYAIAFVGLFSPIARLGLDQIVVRNIVERPDRRDEILGTAVALRLLGGVALYGLAIVCLVALRPDDVLTRWLVAIIGTEFIFRALDTVEFWFRAEVRTKYPVLAKTAAFILLATLQLAMILMSAPLIAFAWAYMVEAFAVAVGMVVVYRLDGLALARWRARWVVAKEIMADSWPMVFAGLAYAVFMRIDQIMLRELIGDEEVGQYSVAVRLAEVWFFIPMAISTSSLAPIVEARRASSELFYERLQKLYNVMALVGYGVVIPMTILAPWLVTLFFGDAYRDAWPMLMVLVWGLIFTNLGNARLCFLTAMNRMRTAAVMTAVGTLLNIAMNFYLIPRYGGVGAAIATAVSQWFVAHGSCFLYRPLFRTGAMLTKALVWPRVV